MDYYAQSRWCFVRLFGYHRQNCSVRWHDTPAPATSPSDPLHLPLPTRGRRRALNAPGNDTFGASSCGGKTEWAMGQSRATRKVCVKSEARRNYLDFVAFVVFGRFERRNGIGNTFQLGGGVATCFNFEEQMLEARNSMENWYLCVGRHFPGTSPYRRVRIMRQSRSAVPEATSNGCGPVTMQRRDEKTSVPSLLCRKC